MLVSIQDEVAEQVAKSPAAADRAGGLRPRGPDRRLAGRPRHRGRVGLRTDVRRGAASTPTGWSGSPRRSTRSTPTASLQSAIGWLNYTIDSELLMNQIAEASKRISALLADAKQYSQMDRAPIRAPTSTNCCAARMMMFGDRSARTGQGQARHSGQGHRQDPARNPVLSRRSQSGVDQHHRQCDPGDGRAAAR